MLSNRLEVQGSSFRGSRFKVQGSGFRGSGFRGSGFSGSRFRGSRFRVQRFKVQRFKVNRFGFRSGLSLFFMSTEANRINGVSYKGKVEYRQLKSVAWRCVRLCFDLKKPSMI